MKRSYIRALHDVVMAALSFIISLYLRLGDNFTFAYPNLASNLLIFTIVAFIVFTSFNIFRNVWRYASLQDLLTIIKAVTIAILSFFIIGFFVNRLENVPRSIFVINWMVLLFLLGGPRFFYRMLKEKRISLELFTEDFSGKAIPIMLIGINNNTELFLRELSRQKNQQYKVVGIVDNDKRKIGSNLYNVKVYGDYDSIAHVYAKLKRKGKAPQKIILTDDYIDGGLVRNLLTTADSLGVSLARLPKLTDFKVTEDSKLEVKPIVIQDLLGRAQNALNKEGITDFITGKKILITGAGGTIGSELTRQIASYNPELLILLDNSEFNLYSIDIELKEKFPHLPRKALLADIRNFTLIDNIFASEKPAIVFHAAALKHVPLVEENSCEGVLTNVIGTKNVADSALKHKAQKMILISTDKAVNPTNIMGATKRVAENYINALGQSLAAEACTDFVTVRFGNVLGSSGSVIPLFEKQLKNGGPVTVTHPDMVRYFMTVREAVELVLLASTIKQDITHSAIFVLDMGEPMKIKDLAMQMIKMAGFRPEIDIKIEYTGIRPGEKLFEELYYSNEEPIKTFYQSIMLIKPKGVSLNDLSNNILELQKNAINYKANIIKELLKKIVNL